MDQRRRQTVEAGKGVLGRAIRHHPTSTMPRKSSLPPVKTSFIMWRSLVTPLTCRGPTEIGRWMFGVV